MCVTENLYCSSYNRQHLLHRKYCLILAPFHKSSTPLKSRMLLFMAPHQTFTYPDTHAQAHTSPRFCHWTTALRTNPQSPQAELPLWSNRVLMVDSSESRRPVSHSRTSTQHQNNSSGQQVARWHLNGRSPPPARTWRGPPVTDGAPLQQPGDFSDVSPDCAASYTLPRSSPGTTPRAR